MVGKVSFDVPAFVVASLFGARSSTGAETFLSCFTSSEVLVTVVDGAMTFLTAVATSSLFADALSVWAVSDAAFGGGIVKSGVLVEFAAVSLTVVGVTTGGVDEPVSFLATAVVVCAGAACVPAPLFAACSVVFGAAAGTYVGGASGSCTVASLGILRAAAI